MTADALLVARTRRAYERSRVGLGLRASAVVAPMALVSWLACERPGATLAGSVALVALVTLSVWRGGQLARGARLGLAAGAIPLLVPLVVAWTGHLCGAEACLLFPTACLAGGVVGGACLGVLAGRRGLGPHGLASAGLAAWLAGSLGCIVAGVLGVLVLVAGLACGAVPVLALRRA